MENGNGADHGIIRKEGNMHSDAILTRKSRISEMCLTKTTIKMEFINFKFASDAL